MSNASVSNRLLFCNAGKVALLALAFLLLLVAIQPVTAARDVRVGLHEFRPTIYTDEQGKPAGIFVDLLTDTAGEEGWNLIWVHGTFQENLDRLAAGDLDLLAGVTDTPDREKYLDFNHEVAVSAWTQVYAKPDSGINTILDLDGKRVALLRGDANAAAFRDYAVKFSIHPTYIESDTISEMFSRTTSGDTDALVVFWIPGQGYAKEYGLSATPVMFNPGSLGFAVPKGKNADLLQALDRDLILEKSDPSSHYSETMQKYFGQKTGWVIPSYIMWGLAFAAIIALLFVIMAILLRQQVQYKTAELKKQNAVLLAANEQLAQAEGELRANYEKLGKSEKALMQARKKLNLLNTLTFQDLQSGIFSIAGFLSLAKEGGCSEPSQKYLMKGEAILQSVQGALRFAKIYQNLGLNEPRWQNVNYILLAALSHLDFSKIQRRVSLDNLEIYADPLLERVFFILMDNVLRHARGATGVILRYEERPEGLAILIEDNGPGIPDPDKERIFEWGYAGHVSDLFLAREILSPTGISIRENGVAGKGARFEILVPPGEYRFVTKDNS